MAGGAFWMKLAYTLSFAVPGIMDGGTAGPLRRQRQETSSLLLLVPVILLLTVAVVQLMEPGANRHQLVMGDSWKVCAIDILTIFGAGRSWPAFWALREIGADPDFRRAGAGAGLLAGGVRRQRLCLPLRGIYRALHSHLVHDGHGVGRRDRCFDRPPSAALVVKHGWLDVLAAIDVELGARHIG